MFELLLCVFQNNIAFALFQIYILYNGVESFVLILSSCKRAAMRSKEYCVL